MGPAISKNLINSAIKQSITSSADVALKANSSNSGQNFVSFTKCNVDGKWDSNQAIGYTVNMNAVQKAIISQETQNKLTQDLQQVAETVAQNFDLNPGEKASINAIKLSAQISTDIMSSIKTNCTMDSKYINAAICDQTNITKTGEVDIVQTAYASAIFNCAQDATIHSAAYQEYVQNISQFAKTTVQNAIAVILAMIAVILLIVMGGSTLGISNLLRNVLVITTILLGLVFLDCYLTKLLCKSTYRAWVIGIAVTIYVLVIFAYVYNKIKAKKEAKEAPQ